VWYRAWTQETAQNMSLKGWVRNRKDGSVEAVITGPEDQLQRFITACYDGPAQAKVETIQTLEGIDEGCTDFSVKDTA